MKLTPLAFIMRACVKALAEFPRFNSALDPSGANLIVRQYVNLGFAADTPQGLVVPVVKDANRKDIYELARHLGRALGEGARRQAPADGHAGRLLHHLEPGWHRWHGLHPDHQRARGRDPRRLARQHARDLQDGGFVPRLMLPLSLSYDHRVIDGAMAARFTTLPRQDARRAARADRGGAVSVELRSRTSVTSATSPVVDVLVKAGDVVELETPLVTLETDKASMDVPASAAGQDHRGAAQARRQGLQGRAHRAP